MSCGERQDTIEWVVGFAADTYPPSQAQMGRRRYSSPALSLQPSLFTVMMTMTVMIMVDNVAGDLNAAVRNL